MDVPGLVVKEDPQRHLDHGLLLPPFNPVGKVGRVIVGIFRENVNAENDPKDIHDQDQQKRHPEDPVDEESHNRAQHRQEGDAGEGND